MNLTPAEIQALAEALAPILVQQLRAAESNKLDGQRLAQMSVEERRRVFREQKAAMKSQGGHK